VTLVAAVVAAPPFTARSYADPPPPVLTLPPPAPPPDVGWEHAEPVGVSVYASDPLVCVIVSVSVPDEQTWLRLPPLPTVEEDSAWGEVSVKVPSVEVESVTETLVAFTTRLSASEPAWMMRVICGEER
jgi:hypothetical protein